MALFPYLAEANTHLTAGVHSKNYTKPLTQLRSYLPRVRDNACCMGKSVYLRSIQSIVGSSLRISGRCNFGRSCKQKYT